MPRHHHTDLIDEQIKQLEIIIANSYSTINQAQQAIKKLQDVRPGVSTPGNYSAVVSPALMKREKRIQSQINKRV